MLEVAYVFERFPSFGQTFCYREVAELRRQGANVHVFSIRRPTDEPPESWDRAIADSVVYLPDEKAIVAEVDRAIRRGELPAAASEAIAKWGRQSDFLRLYQAAYIGLRIQKTGVRRVHAHFAGMAARTAFWIREFFGIDYSFTAHANDIFAPRPFAIDLGRLVANAAVVVTVSDFAVQFLAQKFPTESARIRRLYNGIDLASFAAVPAFDAQPPVIVSVGRLIEKKGFGDLLEACAVLRQRQIAFRAAIIGEGPLQGELEARIATLGLSDAVVLAGPQSQAAIARRFAESTVFALPCRVERDGGMDNLPTVIMEAMAAGLPVVSTRVAGVPEMIEPGATGELVDEGDVAGLATALEGFLVDRERAQTFGARGRHIAHERFSIVENVRQLAVLLTKD